MSYITLSELAEGPGMVEELAQPFAVAPALLAAVIAYDDLSPWSAAEIAAAGAAATSIQNTLDRVDAEMHTYLSRRGYELPLSAVQFPVLVVWARHIARYHLQPQLDRTREDTGRIERDYRAALRALELVADGKIHLGASDPLITGSAGAPEFIDRPRVFGRDGLAGY